METIIFAGSINNDFLTQYEFDLKVVCPPNAQGHNYRQEEKRPCQCRNNCRYLTDKPSAGMLYAI